MMWRLRWWMLPIAVVVLLGVTAMVMMTVLQAPRHSSSLASHRYSEQLSADAQFHSPGRDMPPLEESTRVNIDAGRLNVDVVNASLVEQQPRHVIYRATVELVVDDFEGVPEQIQALAQRFDGFVAGSSIQGERSAQRHGRWTLRVPVERYEELISQVDQIGQLQRIETGSEEVTAQYVDLQSRIRNQQRQEERLLEILANEAGMLEDILKVERELTRVRESLESMQGRLRLLANQTTLSTITINVREIQAYAPASTQTPAFGVQIARTWTQSLEHLVNFGQALVLVIVGITPWLVVIILMLLPAWWFGRRMRRRQALAAAALAGAEPHDP